METRSNYVVVGGVVIAITIALFAGIIWLARLGDTGAQRFDVFFRQTVNGLAIGSAVAFNGVPVGKVDEIKLLPDTPQFVRVRISVAEDVPVLQGTTAALESVGFTGVSQIQLTGAMQGGEAIVEKGPYGVPVIPARTAGLGALLANAPELLNNIQKLTDRLSELLNPENRNSVGRILKNVESATGTLADRAPAIADTVIEARTTLKAATATLQRIDGLVGHTDDLITTDGKALVGDLRRTLKSAEASLARIDRLTARAEPALDQLTTETVPEAGQLLRDLRDLTNQVGAIAAKLDEDPAGALIGGRTLPDYAPPAGSKEPRK
ncbi:hypothetical protein IP88_12315 [alpha proteobacterium AAP81b]|nr:hypothetical protein IP88_12315 [alpha proteobacterium AAP81b]